MKTMTIPQFQEALKAQGVKRREDIAVKCPICHTVQSMQSLINAGAGKNTDDVERFIGFSCVGRWTNAGPYKAKKGPQGKGCDWTLGGLLQLHCLEIIDEDGKRHPRFEPASGIEAQALAAAKERLATIDGLAQTEGGDKP